MQPHQVQWTPDKVGAFWDHVAEIESQADQYFTRIAGASVAHHLAQRIDLAHKTVLDFGCGPGHLFPHLVRAAPTARYFGVDFSPRSVDELDRTWGHHRQYLGSSALSFPVTLDRRFDVVVCCEVIEHLDDVMLDKVSTALSQLLRPGGRLYLTTPNSEDLSAQQVMCPDCGGRFHRWQHQRAWTARSLAAHFSRYGLTGHRTEALTYTASPVRGQVETTVRRLLRQSLPNLCYVGTRG